MTPPIAMLNPETAAPILDCSPDTVAELLNTGELPGPVPVEPQRQAAANGLRWSRTA